MDIAQMEVAARADRDEIRRLREENARLREEATILKYELGVEYEAALHRAKVSGRAKDARAALREEVKL